jgi:2-iminobutanoate/2-iminopropanoate deaminase
MPRHQLIRAEGLSEPISHYSDAVRVGDTVYVSGQASVDRHGALVGAGDVVAQTRQVLDNMKRALAAAGATLDDVVKVTVFLARCDDRPKVNEVRKAYFGANKPASSLVGIAEFAIPGMLVEIEAVAVAPRSGATRGATAGTRAKAAERKPAPGPRRRRAPSRRTSRR